MRIGLRLPLAAALVAAAGLGLVACGSSAGTSSGASGAARSAGSPGRGTVSVLYAGSLVNMMEHDLGPAFSHADGFGFEGVGAGSTELVAQIKGKVRQGDVFISATPEANHSLEGSANGNWVSWYATFARAPLVLGYNPNSSFAGQFHGKPWYRVIIESGVRVGRTDPKLDPKGKLTVDALDTAARQLGMPALKRAASGFAVFPEESLVGRLEAGQLDAGFFYANEAAEQHIPSVPLTPVSKSVTYTVAILRGAADPAAANAFVAFLLGPSGRATLARHGLTVLHPKLVGSAGAVPEGLRPLLGAG